MYIFTINWFLATIIFISSYLLITSVCRIFYWKWIKFIFQNLIPDIIMIISTLILYKIVHSFHYYMIIFLSIFTFIQWIKSKTIGMNFSIKNILIEICILALWIIWLIYVYGLLFQLKPELVRPYNITWTTVSWFLN